MTAPTPEELRYVIREALNLSAVALPPDRVNLLAGLLTPALCKMLESMREEERRYALLARQEEGTIPPEKRLSRAEISVVRLLARGFTVEESADLLGITPDVVRYRRTIIYRKWGESNAVRVAILAVHMGLVDPADLVAEPPYTP
jgi:DNA-binding NarL/FixJ family response regulator